MDAIFWPLDKHRFALYPGGMCGRMIVVKDGGPTRLIGLDSGAGDVGRSPAVSLKYCDSAAFFAVKQHIFKS
ncbi:MAG TPA: hypothetical protein PK208_00640 [Fibrobacteria bacterium]|nr:hypothetical protein [Fibrobacteria bacterium]